MALDKYYSARQVTDILGIGMTTLQRLQNSGALTPDWAGGQRRFAEKEIMRYLSSERQKHNKIDPKENQEVTERQGVK